MSRHQFWLIVLRQTFIGLAAIIMLPLMVMASYNALQLYMAVSHLMAEALIDNYLGRLPKFPTPF